MEPKRPFTEEDWLATPKPVREYVEQQEATILELIDMVKKLTKRVEDLENRLNKNSRNSSKPPSLDPPFKKPPKLTAKKSGKKLKKGGQKGHVGHQQSLLPATHEEKVMPIQCSCGCTRFNDKAFKPFYTHQVIELPPIQIDMVHYILHKGSCPNCGQTVKACVPHENQTGYGPRLSATIAELSGTYGSSRETIQDICRNIFGFHISTGAIQKVIDRASNAIERVYNRIGELSRLALVNTLMKHHGFKAAH